MKQSISLEFDSETLAELQGLIGRVFDVCPKNGETHKELLLCKAEEGALTFFDNPNQQMLEFPTADIKWVFNLADYPGVSVTFVKFLLNNRPVVQVGC